MWIYTVNCNFKCMINTAHIKLTDLKSTSVRLPSQLQTRKCFKVTQVPESLNLRVDKWTNFDTKIGHTRGSSLSVDKAMQRINNQPDLNLITGLPVIGTCDMALTVKGSVVMIGKRVPHLPANLVTCIKENVITVAANRLQQLCHTLVLNDTVYGFLYTDERLIIVNMQHETLVSRPASWSDFILFCQSTSFEKRGVSKEWIKAVPEMVEDPDIIPLSSYETGSVGRLRWWVAHKTNQKQFQLSLNTKVGDHWEGTVSTGKSNESSILQAVFLVSNLETEIRKSASMIQYLNANKTQCAPSYIVYCHIFANDFHVLALEPYGQTLTLKDLTASGVQLMHNALSELHERGVLLTSFSLNSFSLFKNEIKIVDFGHAKLCRKIPDVARQREHAILNELTLI